MKQCRSCKYSIPEDAIRCAHCGADQRGCIRRFCTFVNIGIFATLIMATSIAIQSGIILKQTNIVRRSFELENRPYLYIDISPWAFSKREKDPGTKKDYDNLYVGAELKYKNIGKLPACNIKSEIHFYSDMDKGDNFERLEKWYIEEYGFSFPEPTTLFPYQEGQKIPCRVDCSELTKDYLFTIRVTYTGENPNKVYWYAMDIRYSIEKGYYKQEQKFVRHEDQIIQVPVSGRKEYVVYLIEAKSDYDRGSKAKMPQPLSREDLVGRQNKKPLDKTVELIV